MSADDCAFFEGVVEEKQFFDCGNRLTGWRVHETTVGQVATEVEAVGGRDHGVAVGSQDFVGGTNGELLCGTLQRGPVEDGAGSAVGPFQ